MGVLKKMTDQVALEIIEKLCKGGYASEAEDDKKLSWLSGQYPCISDLIFWDKRNLSPEQILSEAKKIKPILL